MAWDPWELADSSDLDSAEESVRLDIKMLTRYARTASALVAPFRKLGVALETKKILAYAGHIEARLEDVAAMVALLREAPPLIRNFHDEVDDLCSSIADGAQHGSLKSELEALPAYARLLDLGERLLKYEFRIGEEDEDQYINWTLEDYVGPEATIYDRLQKVSPPNLTEDDYAGTRTIYGVLVYYDADYVDMRVDEIIAESEEES